MLLEWEVTRTCMYVTLGCSQEVPNQMLSRWHGAGARRPGRGAVGRGAGGALAAGARASALTSSHKTVTGVHGCHGASLNWVPLIWDWDSAEIRGDAPPYSHLRDQLNRNAG